METLNKALYIRIRYNENIATVQFIAKKTLN